MKERSITGKSTEIKTDLNLIMAIRYKSTVAIFFITNNHIRS